MEEYKVLIKELRHFTSVTLTTTTIFYSLNAGLIAVALQNLRLEFILPLGLVGIASTYILASITANQRHFFFMRLTRIEQLEAETLHFKALSKHEPIGGKYPFTSKFEKKLMSFFRKGENYTILIFADLLIMIFWLGLIIFTFI